MHTASDPPGRPRVGAARVPLDALGQSMPTGLLTEMGVSSSWVICSSPSATPQLAACLKLVQSTSAEHSGPNTSVKASAGVRNGGRWVEGSPLSKRGAQLGMEKRESTAETY